MLKDIRSMTKDELQSEMLELGEKKFTATQIYSWLHKHSVSSFDEMTNISKKLREKLKNFYYIYDCTIEKKLVSVYDETVKYLFKLHDGEFIESVVMKYKYGYTICVSSQVGCKMGCNFCASGIAGFVRNLMPSEILAQVYAAQKDLEIKISHIVMMGVGEPLDNFDNVMRFLSLVTDVDGQNLSMRNISLSTCGVVSGIYKLLEKKLQLTLSISLHAPNDEIRGRTMPVNHKWNIDTLLKACKDYTDGTSRRISFEYAMISGVNDSDECARELASKLRGMLCHVNLIPVNAVKERDYKRSGDDRIKSFIAILEKRGINVTVRRTLGSDINASCGQLRRGG
ncbi:MAG: 23S rRNA (adenine(2503)-C(2))-methyltransferase RlmN [Faecalibacterium sp.]|nr:23S rRNA (adenine(2503)-C(2))-methyltransferase RlmN [Ruminococcus sp.]MCM1392995.1 23S rRNA (adenine(2503)-C(2))-methyltransferase RlmN [Ruminococcus sp.]MCM1484929.1 23S rRNA (adenine(2503)-C(2))-methyltransferase RlmN [Faecalibacterium sp.]